MPTLEKLEIQEKMNIQAIIPFCCYDERYIYSTIDNILPVCNKVRVSYSQKLLGGDPEDLDCVEKLKDHYKDNERVIFTEYSVPDDLHITQKHNISRNTLMDIAVKDNATHLFLVDADEVFEAAKLKHWLDSSFHPGKPCYSFLNYWYFRDITNQATAFERGPMLIKKELYNSSTRTGPERGAYLHRGYEIVSGEEGLPFCHHYSWAMTKEVMLLKVRNWGHMGDKDWTSLVEEEFSRDFNGTDFVHGYKYNKVTPYIK